MQTIKLNSVERWNAAAGQQLVFEGEGARRIRLHVNSPDIARVWLVHGEGDVQFLARVEGYQVVEFYADSNVTLNIDGDDVWWRCAETEPTFVEVVDPVIFTKIANRRHRNPELEAIMYRMQENMDRRLAMQSAEFEAALERRRQEEVNGRPAEIVVTAAPGAAANAGGGEVPVEGGGTPGPVADAGGAGDGK